METIERAAAAGFAALVAAFLLGLSGLLVAGMGRLIWWMWT